MCTGEIVLGNITIILLLVVASVCHFVLKIKIKPFLVHGHIFLKMSKDIGIPLGRFSESALEMRNKDRRKGRLRSARKNSRENNTKDMYQYLLKTSDPLVNIS